MVDELKGKMQNGEKGFGTPVPIAQALSKGRKPMKVKWVFRCKLEKDGSITDDGLKARLVLCGYDQRPGIDYNETFAGTIRSTTVRMFFAVAAQKGLKLISADAVKAFTQSDIDCELYCEMPKGFEIPGKCLLLHMSLEGSKQALAG